MISRLKAVQAELSQNHVRLRQLHYALTEVEPLPDLAAIRTRVVDAIAAGDKIKIAEANNELSGALLKTEEIEQASLRRQQLTAEIDALNSDNAALFAELAILKQAILEDKARVLAIGFSLQLDELMDTFLLIRSVAEQAESYGKAVLIPDYVRGYFQVEIPAPLLWISPTARFVKNLGRDNDELTQQARLKAARIAGELFDDL
jgi:hypothetical protein